MPKDKPSKPKTTDEKKDAAKDAARRRKAGASPFVGESLIIHSQGQADAAGQGPFLCVAHEGDFLHLEGPTGKSSWINTHTISAITFADAPADDSPESLAASLKAAGSPYGPVEVQIAGGPQEAG